MKQPKSGVGAPKAKKAAKNGPKAPVSFKRHILPPILGVLVMVGVLGFLNGQYLQAQWKYRYGQTATTAPALEASPEAIAVDTASPNPERGPYLTIPSINVEAPVVFEPSYEEAKIQIALRDGVVHYGTSVKPGEVGNAVILGHSSGQPWAKGNYKFVFTLLEKAQTGENIMIDYNGTRYTYRITKSFIVKPTDVSILENTTQRTLTLITCTPVGTNTNRLIVQAEQISPLPVAVATNQKQPPVNTAPVALPASASGSIWERIRELF